MRDVFLGLDAEKLRDECCAVDIVKLGNFLCRRRVLGDPGILGALDQRGDALARITNVHDDLGDTRARQNLEVRRRRGDMLRAYGATGRKPVARQSG